MHLRVIDPASERVEIFEMSMNLMPVSRGMATIVRHIRDSLYLLHFDNSPSPEERAIQYLPGDASALLIPA